MFTGVFTFFVYSRSLCVLNIFLRLPVNSYFCDFQHDMLFQAVLLFFSGVSHFFCLRKKCERLEGNSRFPRGRFFAGCRPSFSRGPRASPARRGARRPRKRPSRRPAPRPVPSALYNNKVCLPPPLPARSPPVPPPVSRPGFFSFPKVFSPSALRARLCFRPEKKSSECLAGNGKVRTFAPAIRNKADAPRVADRREFIERLT